MPEPGEHQEFDFTKAENQERFSALPEQEKQATADVAFDKASAYNRNREDIINLLTRGDSGAAVRLLDHFPLPEAELQSPDIQAATKQGLIEILRYSPDAAVRLLGHFPLPEAEVQAAVKQRLIKILDSSDFYEGAGKLLKRFPLPEAEVQAATKQVLIERLRYYPDFGAQLFIQRFPLPPAELQSPDIQAAVKQRLIQCLTVGNHDAADQLLERFPLPPAELQSPDIHALVKQSLIKILSNGFRYHAAQLLERFPLPPAELQSPDIHAATKQGLISCLTRGNPDTAAQLLGDLPLPEAELQSPDIQAAVKQRLVELLAASLYNYEEVDKLLDHFPLPPAELQSPDIHAATKQGLILDLTVGKLDAAAQLLKRFPLPEAEVQAAVKQRLVELLAADHYNYEKAAQLLGHFPLPEAEVQAAVKQRLVELLAADHYNYEKAAQLLGHFPLPEAEVQAAVKQRLIKILDSSDFYEGAGKLLKRFPLPEAERSSVVASVPYNGVRRAAQALGLTQASFTDPIHKLLLELPAVYEVNALADEPTAKKFAGKQGQVGLNEFYKHCREQVWPADVAGWYDSLVSGLAGDTAAANKYLESACRSGTTTHDALQFMPKLVSEYAGAPEAFKALVGSIANPEEAERLASFAPTYAAVRLAEFGSDRAPGTLRDFSRICILIKRNFTFPPGIAEQVKGKIISILDTVGNTEQLAADLSEPNSALIRLLENRDALDEKALIQPIPDLVSRITPLGRVLQGALGSRELQKLQGAVGQIHKELGPAVMRVQQAVVAAEEQRLRENFATVYRKPKDDVELINLKKTHARYLDSLKLVKGNGFEVTEDKAGVGKRLASLIERLPGYAEASPAQKIQLRFEHLVPLYEKLAGLLARERLGGGLPTDPVLRHLAGLAEGKGGAGEVIAQRPPESPIEFRERAADYAEQVLDEYLGLARKTRLLGNATELYRQVEQLVQQHEPGGQAAVKEFFAKPDVYFDKYPELAQQVENILQSRGIATGDTLVARVHAKSDPRGIVCGDATNCCMPYGDEKNYDYMYRSDTAYFTVSLSRDGVEQIVAQSVLVAARKSGKGKSKRGWDTLAMDNIEVAHTYENLVPDIAKLYRQAVAQCWPDKNIIMGTSFNDDRELVREMGELVRNEYQPVEGELEYSDCFIHDTVIRLREPVGNKAEGVRPRLGFVTPAMLQPDSVLRAQLMANYALTNEQCEALAKELAPCERVLSRDEDNDPIFEAENRTTQISLAGKPVLMMAALDFEREESEAWDEVTVKQVVEAPGADEKSITDALVAFLSVQPKGGYRVSMPGAWLTQYHIDSAIVGRRTGYSKVECEGDNVIFVGEMSDEYDDEYEEGEPEQN